MTCQTDTQFTVEARQKRLTLPTAGAGPTLSGSQARAFHTGGSAPRSGRSHHISTAPPTEIFPTAPGSGCLWPHRPPPRTNDLSHHRDTLAGPAAHTAQTGLPLMVVMWTRFFSSCLVLGRLFKDLGGPGIASPTRDWEVGVDRWQPASSFIESLPESTHHRGHYCTK